LPGFFSSVAGGAGSPVGALIFGNSLSIRGAGPRHEGASFAGELGGVEGKDTGAEMQEDEGVADDVKAYERT